MKKTAISVTDAARNFSDCINRVHYQHLTLVLLRNGSPVARLVPDEERSCSGRMLAETLAKISLPDAETKAWRRDLRTARKVLKAQVDKWR